LSAGQQGGQLQCKPIKHLAPALVLTLAALQTKGLPGFADGLELVSRLLGDYWTSLHPLPVDDPEEPFYPRANILVPLGRPFNELNDSWRFVERLYAATLIESPLNNALSVRDCLAPYAAELQLKLPDGRPTTEAMIASALSEAAGLPRQQEVLDQAIKAARNIEAAFRDKAADKGTPPLEGLVGVLEAAARVLKSKSPAEGGTTPGGGAGAQGAGQGNPLIPAGPITSRADAARRLSEVAEYFRQNESSSPVPFLLERVLRVIGSKDFLGLLGELDELGAEALPGFKKLAGIKDPATPPET
jgi:type VI secretion system protein ImpA